MEKPRLHLVNAQKGITTEQMAKLFKNLTGRDPTPEELEQDAKEVEALTKES